MLRTSSAIITNTLTENNNVSNNNNTTYFIKPNINFEDLKFEKELGKGTYGVVYQGSVRNQKVAIKVLPYQKSKQKQLCDDEITHIQAVSSENIVKFVGWAYDPNHQYKYIAMEFIASGSLDKIIDQTRKKDFPLMQRLEIAKGIANALYLLHEKHIIHADVKSGNVLIQWGSNICAKLGDFGNAISFEKAETDKLLRGSLRWAAPEVLRRKPVSSRSDMFSWGTLLWEVLEWNADPLLQVESDYQDIENSSERDEKIAQYVINGGREKIPDDIPFYLKDLLASVWSPTPQNRPTAKEVLATLEQYEDCIPKTEVKLDREIGIGNTSKIFRAIYNNSIVAVKELKNVTKQQKQRCRNEIENLKLLNKHHTNVIKYIGYSRSSNYKYIIMQYATGGSLFDIINSHTTSCFSLKEIQRITKTIAETLSVLKTHDILHGDIRSSNVVFDENGTPLLCDFGSSKNIKQAKRNHEITGAIRWAAPEMLANYEFTFNTEIFSFSMLMWEILAWKLNPYAQLNSNAVKDYVIAGGREKLPKKCPTSMKNLVSHMWAQNPEDRPTIEAVNQMLSSDLEKSEKNCRIM